MNNFYGLEKTDLRALCSAAGYSPVHAGVLLANAYKHLRPEPWQDHTFPVRLGEEMRRSYVLKEPEVTQQFASDYDGSVKFLLRLHDGKHIETVLMPETNRLTVCLSSQVGCRQACTFCHTGRMGLLRNLTPDEIVGQVVAVNKWLATNPQWFAKLRLKPNLRVSNIVFMGMGEPLDNVENVMKAFAILTEPLGLALPARKIAVSTAGHLDGLKVFVKRYPRASLALSLHATSEGERSRLMPINRRWPLSEVLPFFRHHYQRTNPRGYFFVQYTVIAGVNDSVAHAERLVALLHGFPAKLNLIPLNEIKHLRFAPPDPEALLRFRDVIHQGGIRVMIRYSKGQDIAAACGQLVHGVT